MPPEAVDATNEVLDEVIRERRGGEGGSTKHPRKPDAERFMSRKTRPQPLPPSGRKLRREAGALRRKLAQGRCPDRDVAEAQIDDLMRRADDASEARGGSVKGGSLGHGSVLLGCSRSCLDADLNPCRAEFDEDDLCLAYQAFDVEAWQAAQPGSPMLSKMQRAARRLCGSIGVVHDAAAWREGAQAALLARGPDGNNRDAWRSCLDADRLPSALPAEVVRLYLATWDGTGAVERGLGQDKAIIGQHVGSRTRSCLDADLYSCLLELKQEGPSKEEDMFTPTEFSRACALEWRVQHGRRFTCNTKVRVDKGHQLRATAKEATGPQTAAWNCGPGRRTVTSST